MKKFLFVMITVMIWCSCSNQMDEQLESSPEQISSSYTDLELKEKFSKALVNVLNENEEVRSLIKIEALKKINHDYDVLYELVKNETLENGSTLRGLILNQIDEATLSLIEGKFPTMTIFVPTLPFDSFSAAQWDTTNDAITVALPGYEDGVKMFEYSGEVWWIANNEIPTVPTVVVKENERLTTKSIGLKSSTASLKSATNPTKELYFIDDVFDNSSSLKSGRPSTTPSTPSIEDIPSNLKKTMDAYNYFKSVNGWQRDHSYYNLTPTKTRGALDRSITESLITFQLTGNGLTALAKIGDQTGDPESKGQHSRSKGFAGWTDGEFEFKIKIYIGNIAGFGTELIKYVRIAPQNLFDPEIISTPPRSSVFTGNFTVKETIVNLPLFSWDLETYTYAVKIAVEEVDATESEKSVSTTTTEFATNFELNASTGEHDKVGWKWGASAKRTNTTSFEHTITRGNDELGETVISFGDDVIVSDNLRFVTVKTYTGENMYGPTYSTVTHTIPDFNPNYTTGWVKLGVAPIKSY